MKMKRKTNIMRLILSTIVLLFLIVVDAQAYDGGTLPSDQYLQQNKSSSDYSVSNITPFSTYERGIRAVGDWQDPFFPGGAGELGPGGNVGHPAPIGEVTPIVLILFIAMYFIFRCVSASKRKNI